MQQPCRLGFYAEGMSDVPLSPPPQEVASAALTLREWDILFSYTSYFEQPLTQPDFHRFAGQTVHSGLSAVTYYSNGFLAWNNGGVQLEPFDVDPEPYVKQDQATGQFPEGLTPYQTQCALHAVQQRFYEKRSLSSMSQALHQYLRAYLDPCELIAGGRTSIVYPVLTIHRNGVIQASFRVMNGPGDMSAQALIDEVLALPYTAADDLVLPPALLRLDIQQILSTRGKSRRERIKAATEFATMNQQIEQHQEHRHRPGADFGHLQVSLSALPKHQDIQCSLTMLVEMLFNAAEVLANTRRRARWGRWSQITYRQGDFWSGRPHVYLRSTLPHPEQAAELAAQHAEAFGQILARSTHLSPVQAGKELGPSLRLAEDYLSYVGRAASLSVYSAQGLRQHASPDPNGNELIYRLQAKADFADFMAGSYWQCEETALSHAQTVEELIANRERQTKLEHVARHPFNSGELNDWFTAVMDSYDLKGTREAIALNTALKLEKFKEERNSGRQHFQWVMAALLGVIAASTSGARNLVNIIWGFIGGPPLSEFAATAIAFLLTSAAIFGAYRIFVMRAPQRTSAQAEN